MRVYTIQITKWRRLEALGIPLTDITVKSGSKAFAPTYRMVMDVKSGIITPQEYTDMYYSMMRQSYINNKTEWIKLLAKENLVLGCYCPRGEFCHRHLLVDMLVKLAPTHGVVLTRMGELSV